MLRPPGLHRSICVGRSPAQDEAAALHQAAHTYADGQLEAGLISPAQRRQINTVLDGMTRGSNKLNPRKMAETISSLIIQPFSAPLPSHCSAGYKGPFQHAFDRDPPPPPAAAILAC